MYIPIFAVAVENRKPHPGWISKNKCHVVGCLVLDPRKIFHNRKSCFKYQARVGKVSTVSVCGWLGPGANKGIEVHRGKCRQKGQTEQGVLTTNLLTKKQTGLIHKRTSSLSGGGLVTVNTARHPKANFQEVSNRRERSSIKSWVRHTERDVVRRAHLLSRHPETSKTKETGRTKRETKK